MYIFCSYRIYRLVLKLILVWVPKERSPKPSRVLTTIATGPPPPKPARSRPAGSRYACSLPPGRSRAFASRETRCARLSTFASLRSAHLRVRQDRISVSRVVCASRLPNRLRCSASLRSACAPRPSRAVGGRPAARPPARASRTDGRRPRRRGGRATGSAAPVRARRARPPRGRRRDRSRAGRR